MKRYEKRNYNRKTIPAAGGAVQREREAIVEKKYVRDIMHHGVISCPVETTVEDVLGLPRLSGVADASSLVEAARVAALLAGRR